MDKSALRDAGLKITSPRVKILKILEQATQRHMSAEDVYRNLIANNEDVGLATVYRVLTQFEEAGLVTRHNFEGDSAVFELDTGDHHDHLVCIQCGQVSEFMDNTIEQRQSEIANQHGFKMTDHNLTIYGACEACQSAA